MFIYMHTYICIHTHTYIHTYSCRRKGIGGEGDAKKKETVIPPAPQPEKDDTSPFKLSKIVGIDVAIVSLRVCVCMYVCVYAICVVCVWGRVCVGVCGCVYN